MTVFFTSDTHFGDPRALRFDHRPFPDLPAHDAGLVERWNRVVAPGDTVWHLITGNNDGPDTLALPGWASVQAYAELSVDGTLLVLCHYAFRTWNAMGRGSVNLHGHSHGALRPQTRQYDVGVDVWAFTPVTLAEIRSRRRRATSA